MTLRSSGRSACLLLSISVYSPSTSHWPPFRKSTTCAAHRGRGRSGPDARSTHGNRKQSGAFNVRDIPSLVSEGSGGQRRPEFTFPLVIARDRDRHHAATYGDTMLAGGVELVNHSADLFRGQAGLVGLDKDLKLIRTLAVDTYEH